MQSADTLLIPGIYPVIISDAGNCSISSNLIVEIDTTSYIQASLNYEILDAIHPVKITTTLFSGGNYSYLWNNGMTTSEIFVNLPGLYNLIISDSNNCYSIYEILIPDTIDFFSFNISTTGSESCYVGSGTINLALLPNSNNIQVAWSTGEPGLALDSLLAGWYYFTISDGYSSVELSDSVQVFHLANFNYEIFHSCPDTNGIVSSITVEIAGGAFDWMTMTDGNGNIILPDLGGYFQDLYANEYELLMTDTLGCEIEVLIDMQVFNSPINLAQDSFSFCGPTELTLDAFYLSQGNQNWYQYRKMPYQSNPYSGTPIVIAGKDDMQLGMFEIGFEFDFFGEQYTHFYLCTNGWIKLAPPAYGPSTFDPWQIFTTPDNPTRNNGIMPALRDWQPGLNSKAYYQTSGTAPNRTLTVSWDSIPLFSCQSSGKFQVILYESSGIIDFNLENVPYCPSWNSGKGTQGLQNSDGTLYRTTFGRNASTWTASMETVRYYPSIFWLNDNFELIGSGNSVTTFVDSTTTIYVASGNCPELMHAIPVDLHPVEYEALPTAICSDAPLELSIPSDLSVQWSTGSSDQSIEVTAAGAYTLTVTNSFGCQKTDSVWIYEEILPTLIPSDTIYTCSFPVEFSVDSSLAPLWSTGSTSHITQLLEAGDYWLSIHGQHCTLTTEFTLIQEEEPVAEFTYSIDHQNFSVEILNLSQNSWAYEWNFGDGSQTLYETNPVHYYPYGILETYPISLISSNYCFSDTLTQWIQFLSDSEIEFRYTLYPNPSCGMVKVEGKHWIDKITVYSALSVKLLEISVNDFTANLDLQGLAPGVYLLKIESAGKRIVKRLNLIKN
jgi:PKD repeat protein